MFWKRRKTTTGGAKHDSRERDWKELARHLDDLQDLDEGQLQATVVRAIFDYGNSDDRSLIPPLLRLFECYVERVAVDRRAQLLHATGKHASEGSMSANAPLPFLFRETEAMLVSGASLEYAACRLVPRDDQLAGVRDLIGMFRSGQLKNRAGVFAGLVLLGDRRVTALLRECRNELDADEVCVVTATDSGFLYAPVLDFYVEWLDELLHLGNTAAAACVSESLLDAAHGGVLDSRIVEQKRVVPERQGDPSTLEHLAAFTPADYSKRLLPTLERLAGVEGAPPLLRDVVRAWSQ
jgi:hypothetical protein